MKFIANNIFILTMLAVFFLEGCAYKKQSDDALDAPAKREQKVVEKTESEDKDNGPKDSEAQKDSVPTTTDRREDTEKNLEELLDIFFGTFVLATNRGDEDFDTKIDFERMNDLRVAKDPIYMNLVYKIEKKFRDENAVRGKSNDYKKAFYINAYNYFSIRLVNRNFAKNETKLKSILDLSSGQNQKQVYEEAFIRLHSEEFISLNDLKEKRLAPLTEKKDGRVHFALNCISKGCPLMLNKAYTEKKLDGQLDLVTQASLKLSRVVDNDHDKKETRLNKLFSWNANEIISDKGSIEEFITYHKGEVLYNTVEGEHNWSLNSLYEETPPGGDKPVLPIGDIIGNDNSGNNNDRNDNDNGGSKNPAGGGEGSGSGVDNGTSHPCDKYVYSEDENVVTLCYKITDGKKHKVTKYEVTEANLCVIRNPVKDTYALRGTVSSKDKKDRRSIVEVDLYGRAKVDNDGFFEWKVKGIKYRNEAGYNPITNILKFRQNTKGIRRSIRKMTAQCM